MNDFQSQAEPLTTLRTERRKRGGEVLLIWSSPVLRLEQQNDFRREEGVPSLLISAIEASGRATRWSLRKRHRSPSESFSNTSNAHSISCAGRHHTA
jgi:hypothetical protein